MEDLLKQWDLEELIPVFRRKYTFLYHTPN